MKALLCLIFPHKWKPKSIEGNKVTFYRCSRCYAGKHIN